MKIRRYEFRELKPLPTREERDLELRVRQLESKVQMLENEYWKRRE